MKNKEDNMSDEKFSLVELFLVAADIERTFVASRLERQHDNGEIFYTANVKVQEGEIITASENETAVEGNLDSMCILKLDYRLHETEEKSSIIFHEQFFHN